MGYDGLIVLLLKETFEAELDLRLDSHMLLKFFRISSLQKNIILLIIFIHQRIGVRNGYRSDTICNLIHRIGIDLPSKFNLGLYLVALCHCHIAHIISHTHYTDMAALHNTYCCTHPGSNLFLYDLIAPVSNDNLALDAHTAYDMTILTVSVSRLVLIHKVHIDGVVRKLLIELCM